MKNKYEEIFEKTTIALFIIVILMEIFLFASQIGLGIKLEEIDDDIESFRMEYSIEEDVK